MANETIVLSRGQTLLGHGTLYCHDWTRDRIARGLNPHGHCLLVVRGAVGKYGLVLPPVQTEESHNDTALWCGRQMVAAPQEYGWVRQKPPFPRYTLDFFQHCGNETVRDAQGREFELECGHVALTDHYLRILFSSFPYPLTRNWMNRRFASFVPAP